VVPDSQLGLRRSLPRSGAHAPALRFGRNAILADLKLSQPQVGEAPSGSWCIRRQRLADTISLQPSHSTMSTRSSADSFSALLRHHRRAGGLTQEALAERAGLSVRGLQHLEASDAHPFAATIESLEQALDLAAGDRERLRAAVRADARQRASANAPTRFGKLLRSYRLMLGLTQAELAEHARLSARGIADLERGARRSPRADTVGRLVDALHLDRGQREALLLSRRRAPRFDETPETKSAAGRLTNLPAALTSFVGREHEIEDIRRELAVARLVTLVGTGGCGKTRLALEVAGASLPVFEDGVWLVDLAPITDPMLVPVTVLTTLGLREQSGRSATDTLVEHLQPLRLLLVLDNCEHLVDACAQFVTSVLRAAARVRILSTSREPLAVPGERTYRVQSLTTPEPTEPLTAEDIAPSPAVQLLLDRAHLVRPEFMLSDATAPAIASICHRLDGLPLALEFAAARLRTLSPLQVAARLDDRFRLLVSGDRTALPRHRTLAAALDWSFDLLSSAEQPRCCVCRCSPAAGRSRRPRR
jgi:transcriptional regulator with XRE-family HTH domain